MPVNENCEAVNDQLSGRVITALKTEGNFKSGENVYISEKNDGISLTE